MRQIWTSSAVRAALACTTALTCLALATSARAESDFHPTPNTTTGDDPVQVIVDGVTFTNYGLVGVGTLSPSLVDFLGDTLGSFSSFKFDRSTWRRNGDGYSGVLFGLPDRGYNNPDQNFFTDYEGRLHIYDVTFTPDAVNADGSADQMVLTPRDEGILLRDINGQSTSGLDAQGSTTQDGYLLPSPADDDGRVSLDAEGLSFFTDGSFYVSDEYGPNIYYFNAEGEMLGVVGIPEALLPRTNGEPDFNSTVPPETGRRNNQGMEGISISPDGKTLIAVLQSATMQDTIPEDQRNRNNTRILIYDISGDRTPDAPVAHYVLELPILDRDGTGGNADRTAAQSEIFALNDHQFLLLTRDGNGLGVADERPIVYKSIQIVDVSGATNLIDTEYDTGTTPIAEAGTATTGAHVLPTITPVHGVDLVNLLNTSQLARYGMNLDADPDTAGRQSDINTMSEKWEAMDILPTLDELNPQDFFLFVGNDNDFLTTDGVMDGNEYDGGLDNPNRVLVYRLNLPTYADPLFLQDMIVQAPIVSAAIREGAKSANTSITEAVFHTRDAQRMQAASTGGQYAFAVEDGMRISPVADLAPPPVLGGFNIWAAGTFLKTTDDYWGSYEQEEAAGHIGMDYDFGTGLIIGAAFGYGAGDISAPTDIDGDRSAFAVAGTGSYRAGGFFADAVFSYSWSDFDDLTRPASYGLYGRGATEAEALQFSVQAGYIMDLGGFRAGPVGSFDFYNVDVDGFTEHGAAGGNIEYPELSYSGSRFRGGGEISFDAGGLVPYAKASYVAQIGDDDERGVFRLASVSGSGGTVSLLVPTVEGDGVELGTGLSARTGSLTWNLGYEAFIPTEGDNDEIGHLVVGGFSYALR